MVVPGPVVVSVLKSIMSKAVIALLVVLAAGLFLGPGGYAHGQEDEGGTTGTAAGCCAACSAYGPADDERLDVIRQFRDEYLMVNPVGRAVADFYYAASPPIARFIDGHPAVRPLARAAWTPVVGISTLAVDATLPERAAVGLGITLASGLGVFAVLMRLRRVLRRGQVRER
jgi:hypothetical protein